MLQWREDLGASEIIITPQRVGWCLVRLVGAGLPRCALASLCGPTAESGQLAHLSDNASPIQFNARKMGSPA